MKKMKVKPGTDHDCYWREAAMKLAQCVITTLQAGGKIGVGSGLVMTKVNGKTVIERWDKDFIEALAFIGIAVVDKPRPKPQRTAKEIKAKKTKTRRGEARTA
jgi:hypothetical protein